MSFEDIIGHHAQRVNTFLRTVLGDGRGEPYCAPHLADAMAYSLLDAGKRFRPFLVLESASLFGVVADRALRAAGAIECIHCYSLVHDDLPAMDDDDMRRGRPTLHKAFDEATAILAGDALQSLAFEILAHPDTHPDGGVRSDLILSLARASGLDGMAGGQDLDLRASGQDLSADEIGKMQALKTGALITCACEFGAILGDASAGEREGLKTYGHSVGLAFQIADDLLDVEGADQDVGKATGKDHAAGKATFVRAYGAQTCRDMLKDLETKAVDALDVFSPRPEGLVQAAQFVGRRQS